MPLFRTRGNGRPAARGFRPRVGGRSGRVPRPFPAAPGVGAHVSVAVLSAHVVVAGLRPTGAVAGRPFPGSFASHPRERACASLVQTREDGWPDRPRVSTPGGWPVRPCSLPFPGRAGGRRTRVGGGCVRHRRSGRSPPDRGGRGPTLPGSFGPYPGMGIRAAQPGQGAWRARPPALRSRVGGRSGRVPRPFPAAPGVGAHLAAASGAVTGTTIRGRGQVRVPGCALVGRHRGAADGHGLTPAPRRRVVGMPWRRWCAIPLGPVAGGRWPGAGSRGRGVGARGRGHCFGDGIAEDSSRGARR